MAETKKELKPSSQIQQEAFRRALQSGRTKMIKACLEEGTDVVDIVEIHGQLPLHWAVRRDLAGIAELLIDAGADLEARDSRGDTPLITSAYSHHNPAELTNLLLKKGANPNAVNHTGHTAASIAASEGNVAVLKLLKDAGVDLHAEVVVRHQVKKRVGYSLLYHGLRHFQVIQYLVDQGVDVNVSDLDGQPLLCRAIQNEYWDTVRILIDAKVDVEKDRDDFSPLMRLAAAAYDHQTKPLVDAILKKGADPSRRNAKSGQTAIFNAAWHNNTTMITMLIKAGAEVNVADIHGRTPLMSAAARNNLGAFVELVNAGADIHAVQANGITMLMEAARSAEFTKVIDLILKAGVDPNQKNTTGTTALHSAALGARREVVQRLLAAGCELDAKDDDGVTPLMNAVFNSNSAAVQVLLEAGADMDAPTPTGKPLAQCTEDPEVRALIEYWQLKPRNTAVPGTPKRRQRL